MTHHDGCKATTQTSCRENIKQWKSECVVEKLSSYPGTPVAPFAEILFAEKNVAESGGKPSLFAEKFSNIVFDVLSCKSKKDSDPREKCIGC